MENEYGISEMNTQLYILNQILEKIGAPQIRFSVYCLRFKIPSSLT